MLFSIACSSDAIDIDRDADELRARPHHSVSVAACAGASCTPVLVASSASEVHASVTLGTPCAVKLDIDAYQKDFGFGLQALDRGCRPIGPAYDGRGDSRSGETLDLVMSSMIVRVIVKSN